jgi:hypothetical protein
MPALIQAPSRRRSLLRLSHKPVPATTMATSAVIEAHATVGAGSLDLALSRDAPVLQPKS